MEGSLSNSSPGILDEIDEALNDLVTFLGFDYDDIPEGQLLEYKRRKRRTSVAGSSSRQKATVRIPSEAEYRSAVNRIDDVDDTVSISGTQPPRDLDKMKGFKRVIRLFSSEEPNIDYPHHRGIQYLEIDILDSPDANLKRHLAETTAWLNDAVKHKHKTLVHCYAGTLPATQVADSSRISSCLCSSHGTAIVAVIGISRSSTVVIAYLMDRYDMTADDAHRRLAISRPIVKPNPGFMRQLKELEKRGK